MQRRGREARFCRAGRNRAFGLNRLLCCSRDNSGIQEADHFVRSGKLAMVKTRGLVIGPGSFLGSRKNPEFYLLPVHLYSCSPFASLLLHAFERALTMASGLVAGILWGRGEAQICDPIIRWIVIPVIDFLRWVLAVNIEPGEPMGVMRESLDSDDGVSTGVRTARFGSGGHASLRYAPIKTPRFRGVMKQFPQPLRREAELPFAEHGGPPKEKRPAADKAPGAVAEQ